MFLQESDRFSFGNCKPVSIAKIRLKKHGTVFLVANPDILWINMNGAGLE